METMQTKQPFTNCIWYNGSDKNISRTTNQEKDCFCLSMATHTVINLQRRLVVANIRAKKKIFLNYNWRFLMEFTVKEAAIKANCSEDTILLAIFNSQLRAKIPNNKQESKKYFLRKRGYLIEEDTLTDWIKARNVKAELSKKEKMLSVKLSFDILEKLNHWTKLHGATKKEVITEALNNFLEKTGR